MQAVYDCRKRLSSQVGLSPRFAELDVLAYWPTPDLSNVLLLMPSYQGPSPRASAAIQMLCACGAYPLTSFGISEIAGHRNIVAGRACMTFRTDSALEYALWIDDDMIASPSHIAALVAISRSLNDQVAISAIYCKRGNPRVLAMKLQGHEDYCSNLHVDPDCELVCYLPKIIGGMGCLVVPRDLFLSHCERCPQVGILHPGNAELDYNSVPAVCSSYAESDPNGKFHWISEDQSYTRAIPVFAAPIIVAHLSLVGLLPYPDAVWL
jgi:hypothetical protein